MELFTHAFVAMGCPCEVRFYAESSADAQSAITRCTAEALRFETKYSRYLGNSVTTAINQSAGLGPVTIDQETASILKYSGVCYVQSNGLFDITSGVLRQVWRRDMTALPSASTIDTCLEKVGWDKVTLAEDHVTLAEPGMELDFGGVVKEYAADAIAAVAMNSGISHGLVNLGGDIAVMGPQPDSSPWRVGIVHPTEPNTAIATVEIDQGALTTSGGYERYIEIDGRRYSHLINPKTGWPVENLLSTTVLAPQAVVAGSLTSISLLQSPIDGLKFLEDCDVPYFAVDSSLNCHGHLSEVADA